MTPALIALDWGTSSLRGYLMTRDGVIIGQRAGGRGIMQVTDGQFEAALNQLCGDWLAAHRSATLITSGMIGSKQGWREAPYCACPADAAAIAAAVITLPIGGTRILHIVPGVSLIDPATSVPDVMRGEETQIIGAVPATGTHLCVLPGTHSKWAWVRDGLIERFSSWMTGEVYAALTQHTILGRLMQLDAPHDAAAFARGLQFGCANPATLLNRIFSARTLGLFDQLGATALPSYLSGLLIGAELGGVMQPAMLPAMVPAMQPAMLPGAAAEQAAHTKRGEHDSGVILLGSHQLIARYATACRLTGWRVSTGPAECAAHGMHRIAHAAGLLA